VFVSICCYGGIGTRVEEPMKANALMLSRHPIKVTKIGLWIRSQIIPLWQMESVSSQLNTCIRPLIIIYTRVILFLNCKHISSKEIIEFKLIVSFLPDDSRTSVDSAKKQEHSTSLEVSQVELKTGNSKSTYWHWNAVFLDSLSCTCLSCGSNVHVMNPTQSEPNVTVR